MSVKTVLVTGGAGYVGSHACKALHQAGYRPVVYDNLIHGHEWAVRWGPLEVGDITDREKLNEVFIKYEPGAVLHFAAFAYVGESMNYPVKYYRNNVVGTLTLLEVMKAWGVDKIVFSSSCATYGEPDIVPIKESCPQKPINPYGHSKLIVEQMLTACQASYGLCAAILRYFNAAGADPDLEIGEKHSPETHLIPLVLDASCRRLPYVTVFGDDYATPDGTCIRDYIHVTDLATAHLLSLEQLEKGGSSVTYNLGNGRGFSVKEVVAAAERVTGKTVLMQIEGRRAGDPPILVGDSTRIRKELGWNPKYTELSAIMKTAWKWHQRCNSGVDCL